VIFAPIRQELHCRLVGRTSSSAFRSRCFLFCFLLLISFVHGSAQEKKVWGEQFDPEALRRVKTLCVDTSYLEKGEALEIKKFVAKESRPGHLLRQMPWELTDQCTAADAVIRMYFAHRERVIRKTGVDMCEGMIIYNSDYSEQVMQVVLLIYDRASVRILYRTKGREGKSRTALKGPFSKLVKDLKGVQSFTVPPAPPGR
jgi:hypothetical protein